MGRAAPAVDRNPSSDDSVQGTRASVLAIRPTAGMATYSERPLIDRADDDSYLEGEVTIPATLARECGPEAALWAAPTVNVGGRFPAHSLRAQKAYEVAAPGVSVPAVRRKVVA